MGERSARESREGKASEVRASGALAADVAPNFSEHSHGFRPGRSAQQLKQWKRGKTIYRELIRLGAQKDAAEQAAASSRRWGWNSSKLLNTALPNSYYDKHGVPRLAA
jgi:hypothetical protein